jgi:hypothetical protein
VDSQEAFFRTEPGYKIEDGPGAETISDVGFHGERRIISLGGHASLYGVID